MRPGDEVGLRSIAARSGRAMHVLAIVIGIAGCMPMPPELIGQDETSQDASAPNDDGGVREDAGVIVDAGGSQDAGVIVDAGYDSGPRDAGYDSGPRDAGYDSGSRDAGYDSGPRDAGIVSCGANTFDCGGVAPYPEQPRVPGTSCCCTWGFAPAGDGSCR